MNNANAFKSWMKNHEEKYSEKTAQHYASALRTVTKWFGIEIEKPLLSITNEEEFKQVLKPVLSLPNYDEINKEHHYTFSSAVDRYQDYLHSMHNFTWVSFYSEFADILLTYKQNRVDLLGKIKKIYDEANLNFQKFNEANLPPSDIDPFTVFALFNRGITQANRIKIIEGIAKEFNIKAEIPHDFSGVPILVNIKSNFFAFEDKRGDNDIDNLWKLFESALLRSSDQSESTKELFIKCYDTVLNQHGIKWNITSALFWIRPYTFLSLDSVTRDFLLDPLGLPEKFINQFPSFDAKQPPSGQEYLNVCEYCANAIKDQQLPFANFPELSAYAWLISQEESEQDAIGDQARKEIHYWLYSPGEKANKWEEFSKKEIMAIGWSEIGPLFDYQSKEEIRQAMQQTYGNDKSFKNCALAAWEFVNELKPGDIVFVKNGRHNIVGRGVVQSEYRYDASTTDDYKNVREVKWLDKGSWKHSDSLAMKTLTDITDYTKDVEKLNALFTADSEGVVDEQERRYPLYNEEDFFSEVYMGKDKYDEIEWALKRKKNIILEGAPGTGKTYAVKRLAYSLIGEKNLERVQMIQFHQNYSYEDFIEGWRPAGDGLNFEIKKGVFYKFCKKAAEYDENQLCFFIIDEINRGNLSKIFGELFMLIEGDKRGIDLQLQYSEEKFAIPKNVRIIGTMNTADRSIALIDYALRRRFAFIEMGPGFATEGFREYQSGLENKQFNSLIACIEELNKDISNDDSLGKDYCIGHSFFCKLQANTIENGELSSIIEHEIIPLLHEYWFDDRKKADMWENRLRSSIK
ncbi:MAG: AAA family ATPase [Elusimicrobiaceae bacterium]|nr:AAA family ATPase [Elusimicrobiaceae bacterium]